MMTITAMPSYAGKAIDQLRLEDYIAAGKLNSDGEYVVQADQKPSAPHSDPVGDEKPHAAEAETPPVPPPVSPSSSASVAAPKLTGLSEDSPLSPDPPRGESSAESSIGGVAGESGTRTDISAQVQAIYQRFNPSKLPNVPHILEKYKGREAILIAKLKAKYNFVDIDLSTVTSPPL
jgi:hypothetical protein